MSQGFFCPHCQLRNKDDATICIHCGFRLDGFKPDSFTTVNVNHIAQEPTPSKDRCKLYTPQLDIYDLAIFVMDEDEPIHMKNVEHIVLGRECEGLQGGSLNLENYGPLELGVSRRHAQISWEKGSYWLEDLRSTNGTWLNRERIAAGNPYKLEPADKIWIGPLKLMVCFLPTENPI